MEYSRIDTLTHSLTALISRRRTLTSLMGGLFAIVPLASTGNAIARRKRRKKQKRRGANRSSVCTPNCSGKTCGDDGCGGSCGDCTGSSRCTAGTCNCPVGTELCGGECRLACGQLTTRDPRSCRCCGIPGTACDFADPVSCCSGFCTVDGTACEGFPAGVGCRFDAQCASDRCVDGECAA